MSVRCAGGRPAAPTARTLHHHRQPAALIRAVISITTEPFATEAVCARTLTLPIVCSIFGMWQAMHSLPSCPSAPTMRVPTNIHDTVNVYLAFRAALLAVRRHNASSGDIIRCLLAPAFGTVVGGMSYARAARQMAAAYRAVVLGERRRASADRGETRDGEEGAD